MGEGPGRRGGGPSLRITEPEGGGGRGAGGTGPAQVTSERPQPPHPPTRPTEEGAAVTPIFRLREVKRLAKVTQGHRRHRMELSEPTGLPAQEPPSRAAQVLPVMTRTRAHAHAHTHAWAVASVGAHTYVLTDTQVLTPGAEALAGALLGQPCPQPTGPAGRPLRQSLPAPLPRLPAPHMTPFAVKSQMPR